MTAVGQRMMSKDLAMITMRTQTKTTTAMLLDGCQGCHGCQGWPAAAAGLALAG